MSIDLEAIDLVGADSVRDPHGTFARLRAEGPVHWLPRHNAWLLLDYNLVGRAIHDEAFTTDTITPLYRRLSAEDRERFHLAEELFRGWMIFNDPPVHGSLRKPVASAFTVKSVARMRTEIEKLTDEILESFAAGGEQDFMAAVAFPLPAAVIGLLLGVGADRYEDMWQWSRYLGSLIMGKVSRADAWARALAAAEEMQTYFAEMIEFYRQHPGDNLVTAMIETAGTEGPLTPSQLIGACSLLLFAGHETTMSLITTGIYHLTQNTTAHDLLVAKPDLTELAVEELLRFDGPSKILVRRVRVDCEWEGYTFKAGQPVYAATMAANRDPGQFPESDRLVLDRTPNRHVGFGYGRHFCLGAQLARLEAQVVIPRVLLKFPHLRLACEPEELTWHPTIVGRTLSALPVRFD